MTDSLKRSDKKYSKGKSSSCIDPSELRVIKIQIHRPHITGNTQATINRGIDDPETICQYIHKTVKTINVPVFGPDIEVNKVVSDCCSRRSRSKSYSRSRRKERRSRSQSLHHRRELAHHRSRSRSCCHRSRSRSSSYSQSRHYRKRSYSKYSPSSNHKEHDHKWYRRSVSPLKPGEYRPDHPDKTLRYKNNEEHPENLSSNSPHEQYSQSQGKLGSSSPSRTPSKHIKDKSLDRSRRSRSPYYKNIRSRSRSPYKYEYSSRSRRSSVSQHRNRLDRSQSPRRRSRSPYKKRISEIHPEYDFYEGGWLGGMMAPPPNYPMMRYYPPGHYPNSMFPRPMMGPGPIIMPRMPFMPYGRMPRPPSMYPDYNSLRKSTTSHTISKPLEPQDDKEADATTTTEDSMKKSVSSTTTEPNHTDT